MGKIIEKIFVFLGLGIIGLTAVTVAANALLDAVKTNYEGLPVDVLAYLQLAGFPDGLKLILSAYATSLLIYGAKKIGFVS